MGEVVRDSRRGNNTQYELVGLLRQSMYSRLAGHEDTNDGQRLGQRDEALGLGLGVCGRTGERGLERPAVGERDGDGGVSFTTNSGIYFK